MAAVTKVIGGPLDGLTKARGEAEGVRRGTSFAWINAGGAISPAPAPGRYLYRFDATLEAYVFAGDSHARCECGGYYRKAEGGRDRQPCPMCSAGSRRST